MIIFPWKRKKIEKAISQELRQKCYQCATDFNIYKKTKNYLYYYVILHDGTMLNARVKFRSLGKPEAISFSVASV